MMEIKVVSNLDKKVKAKLKNFGKKDSNLNSLNPYVLGDKEIYPELDKIVEKFLNYHKGNADGVFSWVNELNKLAKDLEGENISYKGDSANQHYGLPTHVNGDYKNGLIYHCLFNAGTNGVEDSIKTNFSKDETGSETYTLKEYYKIPEEYAKKEKDSKKEKEPDKGPTDINELISEGKKLENKIINVRNNIIGPNSLLTKELKKERRTGERGYYCKTYYKEILEKNKDFYFDPDISNDDIDDIYKATNNLVNIELYPLRSKNKEGAKYKLNKFSLFGAYIILYRIGKYLNEVEDSNIQKPIFIFRSFSEWKNCIIAAIKNQFNFDKDTTDELFEYLYDNFFLEFSSPNAGSVSSNNLVKKVKIGVERFDDMIDCISKPKDSAK